MESGKTSYKDYESLILLNATEDNDLKQIAMSSMYLSLVDKEEIGRNDME